jgi:hypothetical protein
VTKLTRRRRNRLDCRDPRADATRSENGVTTDVRTDIKKVIVRPERVENEPHVAKLVKAAVPVPCRACHATAGEQASALDKG